MLNDKEQEPDDRSRFLELFNLFPKGNPESAFTVYKYAISSYKTFDGNPVTHDLIKQKWLEYINFCQNDNRNSKYIKSIEKFMLDKDYNTNFNPKFGGKSFLDKY
jgi:hypothetical protein